MSPNTEGKNARLCKLASDLAVECFALQSLQMKLWEFRYLQRFLLWLLFHLEKGKVVISRAGPAGQRFPCACPGRRILHTSLGTYEPNVIHALEHHLQKGGTCIDVGGHVGYLTITLSHLVGTEGQVLLSKRFERHFKL